MALGKGGGFVENLEKRARELSDEFSTIFCTIDFDLHRGIEDVTMPVEDNPLDRDIIRGMLDKCGIIITDALNGTKMFISGQVDLTGF